MQLPFSRQSKENRRASFNLVTSSLAQCHGKASPFLEIFNKIALRSLDHGLILRPTIEQEVTANNCDYDDQDYDEVHVETYNLSYRVLIVVILSDIFAVCVSIIEIFICKFKKCNMNVSWYGYTKKWRLICPWKKKNCLP